MKKHSYTTLKHILNELSILAHPNYSKDFILFSDASSHAIGACLAQETSECKLQPLAYFFNNINVNTKKLQQN